MHKYTLGNVITSVRRMLNEPSEGFWRDSTLIKYINEGVTLVATQTGCNKAIINTETGAGSRFLNYEGYKCFSIEHEGIALIRVTPKQITHIPIDGKHPQYWFEYDEIIGIEPMPDDIYPLTLYTHVPPVPVVSYDDEIDLPYILCSAIDYFVVSRALEQDKKNAPAIMFMQMFYSEVAFLSFAYNVNVPDGYANIRMK